MTTQYQHALAGDVTCEMTRVAEREGLAAKEVRDEVAAGRCVIPANRIHLAGCAESGVKLDPMGIGRTLSTKINANIGASPICSSMDAEVNKLRWAVRYGADAVMDLSTGGGPLDEIRAAMIARSTVPIGTVPMYSMITDKPVEELTYDDMLAAIAHQAAQGVDFFTIHAGLRLEHLPLTTKRTMGIVSRGGGLLAKWMMHHDKQNPLLEVFDDISAICREYDVTYSLGDGLRPGCLADAPDECMVEGPGHIPIDQIQMNMDKQAELCHGAPFYVLGPIVTDVFPGYDHITSTIGAALAATYGASFLCYVTPAEHLTLPTPEDVKAGCIAYKIAAHSADVARGLPGAIDWDNRLAEARAKLDWDAQFELAFDGETAREIRLRDLDDTDYCAMCGRDWCALRISDEVRQSLAAKD